METEASCTFSVGAGSAGSRSPERASASRRSKIQRKKGNWETAEDEILLQWVEQHGPRKWTQCSRSINGRCGKQCRERWVNILSPGVKKGKWSQQEQAIIFEGLCTHVTAWSTIARMLPGRTENAIKNYFYSSLRRIQGNAVIELLKPFLRSRLQLDVDRVRLAVNGCLHELNSLSRLMCEFVLSEQNGGNFHALLCSQLLLDFGKEEETESFLLYPVVESVKSLHSSPSASTDSAVPSASPMCWNCLGASCWRHSPISGFEIRI